MKIENSKSVPVYLWSKLQKGLEFHRFFFGLAALERG